MTKYNYFKDAEGAAFSDPNDKKDKIDWKNLMFQYPKNQGHYVDFKILTDPKDAQWNKKLLVHPFLKTIESFGKDPKDAKWIGTKRCNGMESREVIHCEYCRFIMDKLDKIHDIVKKLFKNKYEEDMKPSEFVKLVNELDKQAEKNEKLAKFKGIAKQYREYTGCMQNLNRYLAVYVKGQGVRLLESKKAINTFVEDRFKEKVDITKLWIRIENNKNTPNPNDYYKVYRANDIIDEPEKKPTESQLAELQESQIQAAYKSLMEKEDSERQLKNLAGDFGKPNEEKELEKSLDDDSVINTDDLETIDSLNDSNPNLKEDKKENKKEDNEEDLAIDSILDDDLLDLTDNKQESIPIRPDEDSIESSMDSVDEGSSEDFSLDFDDDLQSIEDLMDD